MWAFASERTSVGRTRLFLAGGAANAAAVAVRAKELTMLTAAR